MPDNPALHAYVCGNKSLPPNPNQSAGGHYAPKGEKPYTAMSRMCASGQSCGEFVGCEALVFWQPRALLSTLSSHYTILGNPILALVSSGIPVSPSSQIGVRWVSDHEMDT